MKRLMRLNVASGTGTKAEAAGYLVGGKTGTAEKAGGGGYRRKALLSSFIGAFPMNDPRYVVLAVLDEPKGTKKTSGFASGGWTAAPVFSRVVSRIGPLMGVSPVDAESKSVRNAMFIRVKAGG
jgi:cell division protein FtsI (penicillin-binding protein 3)